MHKLLVTTLIIFNLMDCFGQNTPTATTGEIRGPFIWTSKIYPGTVRNYWVYVPKQYDQSKPACLMVVQDGLSRATGWKLPRVLDSLIAEKKVPVMIGLFVDHGTVAAAGSDNYPRYNRSFEYDALGDKYAKFLMEELLPELGKSYNISPDPNDRSIAGASSGAICAFNVAWERPDQFRRVLSTIGTYVGLRGGDEFATLVRKTEPKPLRVFLEDGNKDLNIYAGDWWMANQDMRSALTWAGYEVNYAWGEGGGHDSKHAITILGDALTWLWKDYPAPVKSHKNMSERVKLLVEGEVWNEIPLKDLKVDKVAIGKTGELYFTARQEIYKKDNAGNTVLFNEVKTIAGGLAIADDRLYVADLGERKIKVFEKGSSEAIVSDVVADFVAASSKGLYFTETANGRIGFYNFSTKRLTFISVPFQPTGIALTAEQTFINVGTLNRVFGYSYKILDDGSLSDGQDYVHYHIPYGESVPGVGGLTVDSENLLYSSTSMGIQVSDQLGRVNFIFSQPGKGVVDVKIGGADLNTLFVSCGGKLFSRKINTKALLPWLSPVRPPKPGL